MATAAVSLPAGDTAERERSLRDEPEEPEERLMRVVENDDGEVVELALPLTLELLLHPREGDKVTQSVEHERTLNSLADTLRRSLERRPGVGVFSDLLILWADRDLRAIGPDVFVADGVRSPAAPRRSFDVTAEGASPTLVFEIVSESKIQRDKDEYHNPRVFAKAGVREYVLIYPVTRRRRRMELRVQRLDATGAYRDVAADDDGWHALRTFPLRLGLDEAATRLLVEDAETGEVLFTSAEEEAARRAAEARAVEAEARAVEAEARAAREAAERRRAEAEADRLQRELEAMRRRS